MLRLGDGGSHEHIGCVPDPRDAIGFRLHNPLSDWFVKSRLALCWHRIGLDRTCAFSTFFMFCAWLHVLGGKRWR
ncbi:hypothetical protein AMELA_G00134340 [Ameiurus melas]|uniref:Uncharacterized protein n=1 Tax=Ameiurus melas TaxID=219545 RepID=A0A7J6ALN6_AMEME|nr:hypothetical protein AMELA_G00134340 [Ameiurus melas]